VRRAKGDTMRLVQVGMRIWNLEAALEQFRAIAEDLRAPTD
jgi:hypothetical protein